MCSSVIVAIVSGWGRLGTVARNKSIASGNAGIERRHQLNIERLEHISSGIHHDKELCKSVPEVLVRSSARKMEELGTRKVELPSPAFYRAMSIIRRKPMPRPEEFRVSLCAWSSYDVYCAFRRQVYIGAQRVFTRLRASSYALHNGHFQEYKDSTSLLNCVATHYSPAVIIVSTFLPREVPP
jgi:hypothetical protein